MQAPGSGSGGGGGGGSGSGSGSGSSGKRKRPPRRGEERDSDTEEDVLDTPHLSARSVRLVCQTYNVDFVEGHTRHPLGSALAAAFASASRWPTLARLLLARGADVLCLQEVCEDAAKERSLFRLALAEGGYTLAAQCYNPLIVVPRVNRGEHGDEGAESTKPSLAARRYVQLWVRARAGHLELVERAQGKKGSWEAASQGEHGVAGASVIALVRVQGRHLVGLAGVHFQWGGEPTLFLKEAALCLAATVPGDHGMRNIFLRDVKTERPDHYVSGRLIRCLQATALPYALERVLREQGLQQDPKGYFSPCIILGDTNFRPLSKERGAEGLDEACHLGGPPWEEAPAALTRATYPFSPSWNEWYLPRYDRVLVRSFHTFFTRLSQDTINRRLSHMPGVTWDSVQGALCEARPIKHAVLRMLGDAAAPALLQGRRLSDHYGVAVCVELRLPPG